MRHHEAFPGFDFKNLSMILITLALVFAFPDDATAWFPVGHDLRTEHVLLDLVGIGQRFPHTRGCCIDWISATATWSFMIPRFLSVESLITHFDWT